MTRSFFQHDRTRRRLDHVRRLLREHPVVAILGARQVGKTTLAMQLAEGFAGPVTRFDLEDPDDMARPRASSKGGRILGGFVIDQLALRLGARPEELYFWASHAGAELDLLVVRGRRKLGFEIKRTTAPSSTRSMHAARESLGLDRIDVIHAGEHTFPHASNIRAVAFSRLFDDVAPL